MINPDVTDYVKNQRIQGVKDSVIIENLLKRGWSKAIIDSSFSLLDKKVADLKIGKNGIILNEDNLSHSFLKIFIAIAGIILLVIFVVVIADMFPL